MIEYPKKFFNYYRISRPSFEEVSTKLELEISKYDTNMKCVVPSVQMITVTLW